MIASDYDLVRSELASIPRGTPDQNIYRAAYRNARMNGLGPNPQIAPTSEAAHACALHAVREGNPNFTPQLGSA